MVIAVIFQKIINGDEIDGNKIFRRVLIRKIWSQFSKLEKHLMSHTFFTLAFFKYKIVGHRPNGIESFCSLFG